MHPHGEGQLASLAQSRGSGMSQTDREEVKGVAGRQPDFPDPIVFVSLQDYCGDLDQVGRAVVGPL